MQVPPNSMHFLLLCPHHLLYAAAEPLQSFELSTSKGDTSLAGSLS